MESRGPLKVAVLIDHRPNHPGEVGGLAGTWERVSQAALGRTDLDLTIFFLGDTPGVISLGENVRHVLLRPALGTERLPFLRNIPTHTDLAPLHPGAFRRLRDFHVLHTTDAFHALAKTALLRSRLSGIPMVNSIQTDIIGWARIYTPRILNQILPTPLARWVLDRCQYLDRQQASMEKRFGRYMAQCAAVFLSHERDRERLGRLAPATPTYFLRRGLDLESFHPKRRDRARIQERFGIPEERTLLLFVGRIDPVKGAMVAAHVVRELLGQGQDVQLLMVGDGSQRKEVGDLLGERASLTGNLPHGELGWIYASADLLLFPSEAEVWPNVVMEARACGLAVLACREGARHVMEGAEHDGVLLSDRDIPRWISETKRLLAAPTRLREMGRLARQESEKGAPSWTRILEKELLPVWLGVSEGPLPPPLPPKTQT
jgi:glycosyltransferase involved in cell wall biosynthesis